jgi:hypothetical protein
MRAEDHVHLVEGLRKAGWRVTDPVSLKGLLRVEPSGSIVVAAKAGIGGVSPYVKMTTLAPRKR